MWVTLAVPYDGRKPNDTINVGDSVGAQLIRDGWARRGVAPQQQPAPEPEAAPVETAKKKTAPKKPAQPTEDSPTTGTTQEKE